MNSQDVSVYSGTVAFTSTDSSTANKKQTNYYWIYFIMCTDFILLKITSDQANGPSEKFPPFRGRQEFKFSNTLFNTWCFAIDFWQCKRSVLRDRRIRGDTRTDTTISARYVFIIIARVIYFLNRIFICFRSFLCVYEQSCRT